MNWDTIQAFVWWVGLKEVTNCLGHDNPRPRRAPPENNRPTQRTNTLSSMARTTAVLVFLYLKGTNNGQWAAFMIPIRNVQCTYLDLDTITTQLTFRNLASYIWDGRKITL